MTVLHRLLPATAIDVRPTDAFNARPSDRADNIPANELANSAFRLPAKNVSISVANTGPEAAAAVDTLEGLRYSARLVPAQFGDPTGDRFRIWAVPDFLSNHIEAFRPGRALCLACGAGREAVVLAAAGWQVVALDRLPDALDRGRILERIYSPPGSPPIDWRLGDLRVELSEDLTGFDLVTQLRFSHPNTKNHFTRALRPGGWGLLELILAKRRRTFESFSIEEWTDWDATDEVKDRSRLVVVHAPT